MHDRQTYSLDQIKDMLLARIEDVVHHYAPPAKGSHTTFGKYYTLNPGRADRSVGSFVVTMTGAKAGKWVDYATKDHGDILDLIGLAIGRPDDARAQLTEARAFLGLETLSPEARRQREQAAARAKRLREEAAAREKVETEGRRRRALSLWLSARESLRGTPAAAYLRYARGIDLAQLGRQPRALRYLERARFVHMDDDTGEIYEAAFPAIASIVVNAAGKPVAVHRTYLAPDPKTGRWGKAPPPRDWPFEARHWKAKKVLGSYAGGWITIANGTGPRGGRGPALSKAAPGQHVYISEGIEDALSTSILLPDARVIAAISLSNLGAVALPACVSRVTLVADLDENDDARNALERAVAQHQKTGREVRLWQNRFGGKDLNDALRAARGSDRKEGAA